MILLHIGSEVPGLFRSFSLTVFLTLAVPWLEERHVSKLQPK